MCFSCARWRSGALSITFTCNRSPGMPARPSAPHSSRGKKCPPNPAAPLSPPSPLDLEFTSQETKAVLDNCKIIYKYQSGEDTLAAEAVKLLQRDKIVAWCQGRTEYGHRALGNRSILASPFSEYVIDNINQFIKHREDFHPFALSVPAERTSEFFDASPNCKFMASLATLKNPSPNSSNSPLTATKSASTPSTKIPIQLSGDCSTNSANTPPLQSSSTPPSISSANPWSPTPAAPSAASTAPASTP